MLIEKLHVLDHISEAVPSIGRIAGLQDCVLDASHKRFGPLDASYFRRKGTAMGEIMSMKDA